MPGSQPALNALNFFMADVRDGLGPFLGVYLQSEKWSPSEIGLVRTVGALVGMAATAPLGALVDRIRAKRALIAVSAVITVLASMIILFSPGFINTAVAQGINGIAGAAIGPAIAGMTLGIVGQRGYAHQTGRNEAFNHAGNVAAAVLAGASGYVFGIGAVFVVMSLMAAASLIATWFIDPKTIDHRAARGLTDAKHDGHASGWSTLVTSKPLLVLAATLMLFHLGNAAMLPLLGQALVARGGDPSAYTSATIVVAQLTMVPMAILAARLAETRGYWIVFVLALLALPIRGAIAALVTDPIGLVPVQMLDGVGAGLLGVAVPGLVARILSGTGHVNAGLGAVMTIQGIGAALSPTLGGYVAESLGYPAAFLMLGAVALVALVLWAVTRPMTAQYGSQPD
jgi:predicted MFS family arabinose efflux permease